MLDQIMPRLWTQHIIPLAMVLAYAPHLGHMPAWVSMFFVLLWALHLLSRDQRSEIRGQKSEVRCQQKQSITNQNLIARKRKAIFGNNVQEGFISPGLIGFLRLPLATFSLVGVLLYWGGKLGPLPGTALLSLMLGIKALEITGYRDRVITLYTALFLLFVTVLFHQSLLMSVYILIVSWFLLSALCTLNGQQPGSSLGTSGRILAQALPLAIVFFLIFPRLPGSLFGLTQNPSTGRTGLSPTLSPGSITKLIPSNAPAFRAEFKGHPPDRDKLYWRTAVLRNYDGQKWTPGKHERSMKSRAWAEEYKGQGLNLHIALEPHNSKMLPALDIPVQSSKRTYLLPGQVVRAEKKVTQTFGYELTSVPDFAWPPLSLSERKACLDIDLHKNPRTQKALETMFSAQADPREKLQDILQFFQSQDFSYTLSPPPLPQKDPIDAFLFQTRAGYCEHFAQAAVWMARAAGLPARIVVGYQGGEYNQLAEFILVRESDAHAWAEVWLPGRGWNRIDPTSFVAPIRIEQGIRQIHPELYVNPLWDIQGLNWMYSAWTQVSMAWDALNYSWREWVVGYSNRQQSSLFSALGLTADIRDFLPQLILIALGTFLTFMLFLALVLHFSRPAKQDPVQTLYLRFQKKLKKAGIHPLAYEGPLDLANRAGKTRPDLDAKIQYIISLFIAQRFGPNPTDQGLRMLRKAVQQF
jgi:transglutaminase-like putative cysteine protease